MQFACSCAPVALHVLVAPVALARSGAVPADGVPDDIVVTGTRERSRTPFDTASPVDGIALRGTYSTGFRAP